MLRSIEGSGGDALVVNCPYCFAQFFVGEGKANEDYAEKMSLPILYITQLIGLGMGLDPEEMGMSLHYEKSSGRFSRGRAVGRPLLGGLRAPGQRLRGVRQMRLQQFAFARRLGRPNLAAVGAPVHDDAPTFYDKPLCHLPALVLHLAADEDQVERAPSGFEWQAAVAGAELGEFEPNALVGADGLPVLPGLHPSR